MAGNLPAEFMAQRLLNQPNPAVKRDAPKAARPLSEVASAGFFVRGGFTFRGVKWRWGWVAVSPVCPFPSLHSRGTGRMHTLYSL